MYYIITTFVGSMKELYGWTNDEYLVKEFMRNCEPEHCVAEVLDYDHCAVDFINKLHQEYDISYEVFPKYRLEILTTKTGRNLIVTQYLYDIIMEDDSILYHLIQDFTASIMRLRLLSNYFTDTKAKAMIQYIIVKILPELVRSYRDGDAHNSSIDLIYLMLIEGYALEVR